MIRIPDKGQFSQPNKGDIFGNINRTLNVDFKTSPGKLKSAPRLTVNTKDDDSGIANMGVPQAFASYRSKYYAMCGETSGFSNGTGKLFSTAADSLSSVFSAVTGTPTSIHADFSDMVVWQDGNYSAADLGTSLFIHTYTGSTSQIRRLYVTTWDNTWFTSTVSGSFRTNGGTKNMFVGFNRNLYILDDDRVIYVPIPTYQTNINAVLTTAGAANTQAGTIDFNGAYRGLWGMSTSNTMWMSLMGNYIGGASGTKGYMGAWNGVGTALDQIYDIDAPSVLSGCVHDNTPYIVDAYGILKRFNGTGFIEVARLPVANLNIEMPGIYNSSTNSRWISHRGMVVRDGKININVNNFVSTGVYVEDMPSGIWEFDPKNPSLGLYHVASPCITSTDWGQQQILTAGALLADKRTSGTLLAGYAYYTDNVTTSRNGIFYDDIVTNSNKRSSFVIPFINSPNIEDNWISSVYRFRPLVASEKIIGKWRKAKKANLPFNAAVTWTSTTTFTSTDANFQYASVGDEVEITMGVGASGTAHITVLPAPSAGTYTVTIDTAIGGSSGTGKLKVNNFKKFITVTTLGVSEEGAGLPDSVGTRIQIKTEIQSQGDSELDDLTIINSKNR